MTLYAVMRALAIAVLVTLLLSGELAAQRGLRVQGAFTVSQVRAHSTLPPTEDQGATTQNLSAAGFGFEGGLGLGRVGFAVRYLQSDLTPRTPSTLERQAAEAELMLRVAATPWLSFAAGPHVRWYGKVAVDEGERWVLWEVRVRAERSLVPDLVRAHAMVWPVVRATTDNVQEPWHSGAGGDVGLTLAPRALPAWLRLGYRVEFLKLQGGARRELTDGLMVVLGIKPLYLLR